MARTQDNELLNTLQKAFKHIENEYFDNDFQGLFSEINLASEKLGRDYESRNKKLATIIQEIADGISKFSTDTDILGDAYEYLIGLFAAGSGKKAGEFYTPQPMSTILSRIVTLDSQDPTLGKRDKLNKVLDFACGSGSLMLNVRGQMDKDGIGKLYGQESNITTYNLASMNMLLHSVKDTEFDIYHGDTLKNEWNILNERNPAKKSYSIPLLPIHLLACVGSLLTPQVMILGLTGMALPLSRLRILLFYYMVFTTELITARW